MRLLTFLGVAGQWPGMLRCAGPVAGTGAQEVRSGHLEEAVERKEVGVGAWIGLYFCPMWWMYGLLSHK